MFWGPDGPDRQTRALNYRDLYPEPPPPGWCRPAPRRRHRRLCASIASVMGAEAIKLITGIGEPLLGRLLIYDALAMSPVHQRPQDPRPADHQPRRLQGALRPGNVVRRTRPQPRGRNCARCWTRLPSLIDVRDPAEWDINHIDGAVAHPGPAWTPGTGSRFCPRPDRCYWTKTGVRSA